MEKPLVGQKVDQLLDLILERNYETGAKLPNEFELAEDLNVGRSTIREAVRTLVARNILEVKQGSGTFISPKRGVSEDPFGFSILKNSETLISDMFAIRLLVEPKMASLAAQNIKTDQLEVIENLLLKIILALKNELPEIKHLDTEFHKLLAKYSENIVIERFLPTLLVANTNYKKYKKELINVYEAFLVAFKTKNSVMAEDLMNKYLFLYQLSNQ